MKSFKLLLPLFPILILQSCDQAIENAPDISVVDQSENAAYTVLSSTAQLRTGTDSDCEQGGVTINTGFDSNGNAELDEEEITDTLTVCNGLNGVNGTNGIDGVDGEDGTNGTDGVDGLNGTNGTNGEDGLGTLVVISDETTGDNCLFGGKKIEFGLDANANSVLDNSEIAQTHYFCSVLKTLVEVTYEPWGDNCFFGGDRIETGVDLNADNVLNEEEVYDTDFACTVQNRLVNTYICRAAFAEDEVPDVSIEYRLDEYSNGEIEVTAEIITPDIGISKSNRWSPWIADHTTPWSEGLVRISFDMVTPANNGFWLVGLDRGEPPHTLNIDEATTDIVVEYRDDDVTNDDNRLQWTVNFGECISAMEAP